MKLTALLKNALVFNIRTKARTQEPVFCCPVLTPHWAAVSFITLLFVTGINVLHIRRILLTASEGMDLV